MKFENHEASFDLNPAIVAEIKRNKEIRKLGTIRRKIKHGHIYQYDIEEKKITEVFFEKNDAYVAPIPGTDSIDTPVTEKLTAKANCLYVEAINLSNALRKLKKGKLLFSTLS